MTIQGMYVGKHVLHCIYVFFTLFGYFVGGGVGDPKGLVHNLLMQLFALDTSKIEVVKTSFYDVVTIQYEHPRYVKHVLRHTYVFFRPLIVRSKWRGYHSEAAITMYLPRGGGGGA